MTYFVLGIDWSKDINRGFYWSNVVSDFSEYE